MKKSSKDRLKPHDESSDDLVRMTSESYDEAARRFRDHYYPKDGTYRNKSVKKGVVAFVRRMAKTDGIILDLGCGPGIHTDFIRRMTGSRVIGIDISHGMLKCAKEQNPEANLVMMDVRNLALRDSCCEGIWSSCMVHHIPRDETPMLFSEIFRVSRPGGIVYVIMNSGTYEGLEEENIYKYGIGSRFISSLEKGEAKDMFEEAGFEVLSVKETSEELLHLVARKPCSRTSPGCGTGRPGK
jgi:ubiquinone/menaquinone biosynthesis C-methylase UbiE